MLDVFLPIMGVVLFSVGAIILGNLLDRRRCRALKQEARQLGFCFMGVVKLFDGSASAELTVLLGESSSPAVEKLMQGTISGHRVLVFNLRAYSLSGEGATVTTFAAFHSPANRLPVFQVHPKNLIDLCRGALVRTAVDRDMDPEFSKKFLPFRAEDARERRFFTGCKLLHLRQCADHFQIRSSPHWLLIFRPGGTTNARNLPQFVHLTSPIAFGLLDPELQPG
ncbi:MAG TPA: hypothetical protein VNO32_10265 [Candidatus Acidoferrum sp.]|nr:hypothetical protein [Candidatus Acidoferrum sp.]